MQIKNDEITVVLQGPIIQGETEKSISSIRTFLQGAKIILSTWQGSETKNLDVDEVVLNQDPSSYYCGTTLDNKKIFYNLNRQLLSTQNGIKRVHTKYTLKLRSDMYFTKDIQSSLLNYFDKFKERNSEYSFFKHRVIVGSLTSKLYSDSDERAFPLPFHVSDWFFFGLSTDIKDYFLDTTLLDEKEATKYPCIKYKIPVLIYNWKFPPEQYLCSEWLKRHIQFKFSDWSDWNIENVLLSEKVIANNFIVLDTIQHGLYSKKYSDLINDNDGEVYSFQGYISNLKFCELYKKYCDNNFKIASNLYYSRNNTYNKLVKKIRKYNNYSNSSFVKIFKIAIIKIKLLLLKKRIYLNLKKNKQKIKDKKYDLIIPCSNCRPTFHLKRFGLRTMALPLDYMCNFKLIDVCNLLRNDFKGFLYNVTIDKENDLKDSIYLSIINKEYNILCLYHYLKNANFSTEKNRVYELFQKRYHNLKQILDKGIFACIIVENENKEDIEYFLDVLSAKFSNSRFDIINVINDKTNSQLVEKIYFYNNSKITQYQFNDIYVGCYENIQYAGNTYYWRKILKKLKVSFQCCHKELHNVEESHSSCIQKIIDKIRGKKKYNVLSRVACLGGATVNSIKNINWLYNFQKNIARSFFNNANNRFGGRRNHNKEFTEWYY